MCRISPISLIASLWLMVAPDLLAQRSLAMRSECKAARANTPENRQQADAWVQEQLKAFLPPPGMALRLKSLQLTALQTELALKQIMMTCEQHRDGRIDYELADIALAGYEQTIQDFLHDLGNETKVLAGGGQVSQMAAIRQNLTTIAGLGRQAALRGLDQVANEAGQVMVETLINFSSSFLRTCWDQSFDDEIAFGLERQNQILATKIDVMPCAHRRFTADLVAGSYKLKSCSLRGAGDWRVTYAPGFGMMGEGVGSGKLDPVDQITSAGNFSVDWTYANLGSSTKGKMQLTRHDSRDAEGNVVNVSYMLSGDFAASFKGKGGIALATGRYPGMAEAGADAGKSEFEVQAAVSEKPCRSLDS